MHVRWRRGADPEWRALELVRVATARSGREGAGVPPVPVELLDDAVQSHVPGLAAIHRVGGSVLAGLDGVAGVWDDVRSELAEQRAAWAAHHLASMRVLREIGDALGDVRWLVYKGPVLAAEAYAHPGERAYGDLDLLIHPRDLAAGVGALEELGFVHGNHHWRHAAWIGRAEFPMTRGDVELDVHWHLQYAAHERADLTIDLDELFRRVRPLSVGGVSIPAPSRADSLLLTGYHACRSGGHRLIWLKDLERLLADELLDLDEVARIARAANLRGQLTVALDRSARVLGFDASSIVDRLDRPLLVRADRIVSAVSLPLRPDERDSLARAWARSIRGGPSDSIRYLGRRAAQRFAEVRGGAPPSRLDDESEKQAFFDAVAASV